MKHINENEIIVSIICDTYNQEEYIEDAIRSFLMQKTKFKYEILVHDDASIDRTPSIIRFYEKLYPDIIKPIYQSCNQYSQNIPIDDVFQIPRAKGKYIAYCEGDDYWTDCNKLQRQVDLLEKNPNCNICAHSAVMVDEKTKKRIGVIAPCVHGNIIPIETVILGGGGFVATNSLMLRKEVLLNQPRFRRMYRYDYTLQIMGSLNGGMLYMVNYMSAYRFQAKSSWTERMKKDPKMMIEVINKMITMLNSLDDETDMRYHETISEMKKNQQRFIADLKAEKYDFNNSTSYNSRMKSWFKYHFPFLLHMKK